jgi:hypothetical protein
MKCALSIPAEKLARFWLDDLSESEAAALEDHVFECGACDESLRRLAGIAQGIRIAQAMYSVPPLPTPEQLSDLQSRGLRLTVTHVAPGSTTTSPMDPSLGGVVFVLHADLSAVEQVDLEICSPEGARFLLIPAVPFNRLSGEVLLACSRHIAQVAPVSRIRLLSGDAMVGEYHLVHPAVDSL